MSKACGPHSKAARGPGRDKLAVISVVEAAAEHATLLFIRVPEDAATPSTSAARKDSKRICAQGCSQEEYTKEAETSRQDQHAERQRTRTAVGL